MIHILLNHIPSVVAARDGKNSICMMVFYFELINFAFQITICILLVQEAHAGGLMGHFGAKKIEQVLTDHFFCPKMRRDMERHVLCCETCHKAKSHLNPFIHSSTYS